jgi:6-phosphogluconolactonase
MVHLGPVRLALGFLLVVGMAGCGDGEPGPAGPRVYVGTGSGDPAEGIHAFRFDSTDGTLAQSQPVTPLLNPTYLALGRDEAHLYSVRETTDSATVHAFDVDPASGALTEINAVPAEGGAPCYVSVDRTGQWVFVANYVGGNVAVFPTRDDGGLGPATQVVQHTGSGADPNRQAGPHAHYVRADPQNRFVLAADLGIDQVRIYPFDADTGRLNTANARAVSTPPGTGPRHLAFHPSGDYVYLVGELSGTVTVYEYDAGAGRMSAVQTVSTVPEDFEGAARSADIHVHPNGDVLYVSNRGEANDIVHYRIDEQTGRLSVAGRQDTSIRWPRNFALSPGGRYLLVANRRADAVTVYRVDPSTGALTFTGTSVAVPEPTKIEFAGAGGS